MLLAERTQEHMELFNEGVEAEFFGSIGELQEKATFYLDNSSRRVEIAQRGRERVLQKYQWGTVLAPAIDAIEGLRH